MVKVEEMVAGFLFNSDYSKVLLIKKKRPKWQKGKFNGVGGHIEPGETPAAAMHRELHEESGYTGARITHYATLYSSRWEVHFFSCVYGTSLGDLSAEFHGSPTNEEISIVNCNKLPKKIISNLKWLIPMAIDCNSFLSPIIMHDKAYNIGLIERQSYSFFNQKHGGIAVSSNVDNLVKVRTCYQCGIKVTQAEIEDSNSFAGECNECGATVCGDHMYGVGECNTCHIQK